MSIWKTLDIEECHDKDAITNAYREKLLITNPEDSPEAFKKLRSAYEEALYMAAEAKTTKTPETENLTPVEQFMQEVLKLYNHFTERLNPEKWRELLARDICHSLDTKMEVRNALLKMLMENFRLPMEIWKMLNETFSFQEDKEELLELYPADFIYNAVLYGIENELSIRLELFDGEDDADYDQFITYYFAATRAIDDRKMDEAWEILSDMQELNIYHPYMDVLEIRIMLIGREINDARFKAELLFDRYPDDKTIQLYMGETAFYSKDIETARKFYEMVKEEETVSFLALFGLASCLKAEGKLEEAKDEFFSILKLYPNSNHILSEINELNDVLIDRYKVKQEKGQADAKELHNLGWAYLQKNMIKEGVELLLTFKPVHEDRFGYLNLCGRLYLSNYDFEKALHYFERWSELTADLKDDGSKEVKKEIDRKELPLFLQSVTLMEMKRMDEALHRVEQSLEQRVEKGALLHKGNIYYAMNRFKDAILICDEIEEIDAEFSSQYLLRGKCLFELDDHSEAFQSFNEALRHYAYSLEPYIYKIRILVNHEQFDQAQEIVEYLEKEGVESDRLLVCKAQLMDAKGDPELTKKAQSLYKEVIDRCLSGNTDMDWKHYVCYLLAVSMEQEPNLEDVLTYIHQGLEFKPDDTRLMDYEAFIYKKHDQIADADECYRKILKIQPDHYNANSRLGYICFENKKYSEALICYERLEKIRKSAYTCEMIGRIYLEQGRFEDARQCFQEAIELNPQESGNYHYLAVAFMCLKECQSAVECGKQTVNVMVETKDEFVNAYRLMAQNYSRLGEHQHALDAMYENRKLFGSGEDIKIVYAYMRSGDYGNAMAILKQWYQTAEDKEKEVTFQTEMANIQFCMRNWKEGYKILKRIRNKNSTHMISLWGYYLMQNRWAKALATGKQYVAAYPREHFGHYLIAKAAFFQGNVGLARIHALKSLDMLNYFQDEVDNQAYWACQQAKCLVIIGDYDAFRLALKRARSSHLCMSCYSSGCYEAHEALAFYFEAVGDTYNANKEYETALAMCKNRNLLLFKAESLKKRLKVV